MILDAALDLIAEKGFHGAPMSQVSKRSGVSTGNIYHYFAGKDDLIHALYKATKTRMAHTLIAGIDPQLDWGAQMRQIWLNAFRFYVDHPRETGFMDQYENSPYYDTWDETAHMNEAPELYTMLQAGRDAGLLRDLPYDALYALTLGVARVLAKRQTAGTLDLDDVTLNTVAEACYAAITHKQ